MVEGVLMEHDLDQLSQELLDFPRRMYEAEKKAEELHEGWLVAEAKRDFEFSRAFLLNKAKGANADQAKHQATVDVFEIQQAQIKAESSWRRASADLHYLENKFTAIRKIANIEEAKLMKLGAPTGA